MIGSSLQHGCRVEEEEAVEVVRNHEDGTRMGNGFPIPKEVGPARRRVRTGDWGSDSSA
jgi:hypothetical protein